MLLPSRSPPVEADNGTSFQVKFLSSDPDFVHSLIFVGKMPKDADCSLHLQVVLPEDYPTSSPKFQVFQAIVVVVVAQALTGLCT